MNGSRGPLATMQKEVKEPFGVIAGCAALWLLFLAPFFYASYGAANWLASLRADVPYIVFWWERWIPFIAWTIFPYWSINLLYAAGLLLNETKRDVDRLAGRYLTAQLVAVACFIAFPLTMIFKQPPTTGPAGFMFDLLGGFDKPFNQAPSLHVALLVIVWDQFRHRLKTPWVWVWHAWSALIGLSVLTTYQHHFIDIPTGALLGLFALWLFPRRGPLPFANFRPAADRLSRLLCACYSAGAAACLAGAWAGAYSSPLWLALLWPAVALAIVAFAYAGAGVKVFQKDFDGNVSIASRILLLPYRLCARFNVWAWTRRLPPAVDIGEGMTEAATVSFGRFPTAREANDYDVVVDVTAEFVRPRGVTAKWQSVPMLDLAPVSEIDRDLAAFIVDAFNDGTVLICCALGFQRSASVAAAWLVRTGRAATLEQAAAMLAASGRPVHLPPQRGDMEKAA